MNFVHVLKSLPSLLPSLLFSPFLYTIHYLQMSYISALHNRSVCSHLWVFRAVYILNVSMVSVLLV
jgi:hypothetical protein